MDTNYLSKESYTFKGNLLANNTWQDLALQFNC